MKGGLLLSRKKKDDKRAEKLKQIFDEEPPTPSFFNERREEPTAFKLGREWYCGRTSCKNDKAMLFDLGNDGHVCGHCYHVYYL